MASPSGLAGTMYCMLHAYAHSDAVGGTAGGTMQRSIWAWSRGPAASLSLSRRRLLLTLMRAAQGRALGGGGYWSHGPGAPPCLLRISATWVVDGSPPPDCNGLLPSVDSVDSHTPCSLALFLAWIGELPVAYVGTTAGCSPTHSGPWHCLHALFTTRQSVVHFICGTLEALTGTLGARAMQTTIRPSCCTFSRRSAWRTA